MLGSVVWRSSKPEIMRRAQVLVTTDWVAARATDPSVRIVEVDVDTAAYSQGHVPNSIAWNWTTQLCDRRIRDILHRAEFEALTSTSGIDHDTTVVLYGDNGNWFAAWAFWQLKMYGHRDVRLMDGGRRKWLDEGWPLSTDVPAPAQTRYRAPELDRSLRAMRVDVERAMRRSGTVLIDVRSPQEFSGEVLAPLGLAEGCQRGGHIPGAVNVTWSRACNEDGTFRTAEELAALYQSVGATRDTTVITYCRIGERSSHSWFVLKYLLEFPDVRHYDGGWTEWGNAVGAPVEVGR